MISVMKLAFRRNSLYHSHLVLSVAIVSIAFLGAAHIIIRTSRYGMIITPDSLAYAQFAETLAAGNWFEGKLLYFPPVMSVVLGFLRLFGVPPIDAGRFLNIIGFGLIILIISYWLHQHVKFRLIVMGTAIAIAIGYPVTHMASWMLTEILFTLMVLLVLVQLESFLGNTSYKFKMVSAIVLSALAPLTRWIGITVIATGVILILTRKDMPTRVRWRYTVLYGGFSSLPLVLWLIRNWIVGGVLQTEHYSSTNSLWGGLSQWDDRLHSIVYVGLEPGWLEYLLWIIVALIIYETAKFLMRQDRKLLFSHQNIATIWRGWIVQKREQTTNNLGTRAGMPFLTFTVVYMIGLFWAAPVNIHGPLLLRLFGPPYVTAIALAAVLLNRFMVTTYQNSGLSIDKSTDGWVVTYNRFLGRFGVTRYVLYGLIVVGILDHYIRHIGRYISVLVTYDWIYYQAV